MKFKSSIIEFADGKISSIRDSLVLGLPLSPKIP